MPHGTKTPAQRIAAALSRPQLDTLISCARLGSLPSYYPTRTVQALRTRELLSGSYVTTFGYSVLAAFGLTASNGFGQRHGMAQPDRPLPEPDTDLTPWQRHVLRWFSHEASPCSAAYAAFRMSADEDHVTQALDVLGRELLIISHDDRGQRRYEVTHLGRHLGQRRTEPDSEPEPERRVIALPETDELLARSLDHAREGRYALDRVHGRVVTAYSAGETRRSAYEALEALVADVADLRRALHAAETVIAEETVSDRPAPLVEP